MKVEDDPIPLKLKHLLNIEAIDHPQQVDEVLPLLSLCLELPVLDEVVYGSDVISEVLLVDLFTEDCVLTG